MLFWLGFAVGTVLTLINTCIVLIFTLFLYYKYEKED